MHPTEIITTAIGIFCHFCYFYSYWQELLWLHLVHFYYSIFFPLLFVAKGDNVSHCMDLLGLTTFGDLFENSGLVGINETGLTFFVPTNEAIASFVPGMNSTIFVGNHIINGTVKPENLTFTGRFMTLSGGQLRSTAVVFADLTLALYSSGAQYLKSNSRELSARHTNVRHIIAQGLGREWIVWILTHTVHSLQP